MKNWTLHFAEFVPAEVGLRESLCTLGNGYFATRGTDEEKQADGTHYPGTYLAFGYNKLTTPLAGREVAHEDLVNFPNWLGLKASPANSSDMEIVAYRLRLDMRWGILERTVQVQDESNHQLLIRSRRLVSMAQPHLAAIEYQITPLNWSGTILVTSSLDGSVVNNGVARYRQLNNRHLIVENIGEFDTNGLYLCVQTKQSLLRVCYVACIQLYFANQLLSIPSQVQVTEKTAAQQFSIELQQNQTLTVEKTVAIYSSKDAAIHDPKTAAQRAIHRPIAFKTLLTAHRLAWKRLWRSCKLEIKTNTIEPQIIRLHIFHLLQSVSPHSIDLDAGAAARGLHGEAYRGHVFWDEVFILPFFTLRLPQISRALLMYRYRRLDAARRLAQQAGYNGAMYPWQSASDGDEVSQQWHLNPRSNTWGPDYSSLQRHVNAAIAYNIWHYYQHTNDQDFLDHYGAEMLLEIARFWASIAIFNPKINRYEIKGVMGPDEYHEKYPGTVAPGLDNNAYTNVMAVWVIERALSVMKSLPQSRLHDLKKMLYISEQELKRWQHITHQMFVPFHDGIISQFSGYERLKEFNWQRYQAKYTNLERLDRILKGENDSADHYQVAKQADVVMLFYLFSFSELETLFAKLGYTITKETVSQTINYYLARTSHGSTLSKIVYASVLTPLDPVLARNFYNQALLSDRFDTQKGTTAEGIHLGVMAGTVNYIHQHYLGVLLTEYGLVFQPKLPKDVKSLKLRLQFRDHSYVIIVSADTFTIILDTNTPPHTVKVFEQALHVAYGKPANCKYV